MKDDSAARDYHDVEELLNKVCQAYKSLKLQKKSVNPKAFKEKEVAFFSDEWNQLIPYDDLGGPPCGILEVLEYILTYVDNVMRE
jgi:hypothetical protein